MIATVGRLLDEAHARMWEWCALAGQDGLQDDAAVAQVLAAWPKLAAATIRVLEAVPLEPRWLDDTGSVREVLAELAKRPVPKATRRVPTEPEQRPPLDKDLTFVAGRVGIIAELLVMIPPAHTEADVAALRGLHANVVAIAHAAATTTVTAIEDRPALAVTHAQLRGLVVRAERFAATTPDQRAGRFEDVAAVTSDGSLDAAIAGWTRATVDLLTSRHRVTHAALQVAAGDALIITAAAATVCAAASELGIIAAERGTEARSALAAAHAAWVAPTSWPATVRLDGVRDVAHMHASRELRRVITENLRVGRAWRPVDELATRFDVAQLLGTMRRGLHAVGNVALAHFQAVDTMVRGPGQLWIHAEAITQPAYRGYGILQASRRKAWVPMPPFEPAAQALLADAKLALATTTTAVAALDATATSVTATARPAAGALRWEQGRIVAIPAPQPRPTFETIRSSPPAGVREERKAGIRLDHRPDVGPRR